MWHKLLRYAKLKWVLKLVNLPKGVNNLHRAIFDFCCFVFCNISPWISRRKTKNILRNTCTGPKNLHNSCWPGVLGSMFIRLVLTGSGWPAFSPLLGSKITALECLEAMASGLYAELFTLVISLINRWDPDVWPEICLFIIVTPSPEIPHSISVTAFCPFLSSSSLLVGCFVVFTSLSSLYVFTTIQLCIQLNPYLTSYVIFLLIYNIIDLH